MESVDKKSSDIGQIIEAPNTDSSKDTWVKSYNDRASAALSKPNTWLPLVYQKANSNKVETQYNDWLLSADTREILESVTPSTCQVLDFILVQAQKQRNKTIKFTRRDFLSARGISDKDKNNTQLRDGIETLFSISLKFFLPNPSRKRRKNRAEAALEALASREFRIIQERMETKSGSPLITVVLSDRFYEYLMSLPPSNYPSPLLKCDPRTNSYNLGRKLWEHWAMGRNATIISVASLLASCGIPTYASADAKTRKHYDRTIAFFIRDMDRNKDIYSWTFCLEKSAPLPSGFRVLPSNFHTLYISYKMIYSASNNEIIDIQPEGKVLA